MIAIPTAETLDGHLLPPRTSAAARIRSRLVLRRLARGVIQVLKWTGHVVGFTLVALPALSCRVEAMLSNRGELFLFWGQSLALAPGLPGKYLRRCFYYLTLCRSSLDCEICFMAYFNHREADVGRGVYIGPAACVGKASLGDGALIGTRASIINGGRQHDFGADGKLIACEPEFLPRVHVGADTWVGEAAVLMADVGSRCIVAAGAVISSPVPDGCIVGGNPARFVARVAESGRAVAGTTAKESPT